MNDQEVSRKNIEEFYDELAPDYDAMTGFKNRFVVERPYLHMLVERYGIRRAIDVGSGTGFHALALAQLGVQVTAVDVSPVMLERLAANAHGLSLQVETLHADMQSLAGQLPHDFDAVFCLGNTLVHILGTDELKAVFENFRSVLAEGGILVIQIVNYDRILAARQRIQSVKESGDVTFVRFYDFEDPLVRFNILKLERAKGSIRHALHSVQLRPVLRSDLESVLREQGFSDVQCFGGISLEPFSRAESKDLVAIARRG